MAAVCLSSNALPPALDGALRRSLGAAHAQAPFSVLAVRDAVRRAGVLAQDIGLRARPYRGALELRGAEVEHVWLMVDGVDGRWVVDAAFPLHSEAFVMALRRYIAGEADSRQLARAADESSVEQRVIGAVPVPMRYRGAPLWGR